MKKSLSVIIGISIILLAGCREGGMADTEALPEESQADAEEDSDITEHSDTKEDIDTKEESGNEGADIPREVPKLPDTGGKLTDFVPEGWEVLDCVELDFNEDGIPDHVGVLEETMTEVEGDLVYQGYPRILFAIASDEKDGYHLDFQDINLIRTRDEGGIFGDPYQPLTVEGLSFTTNAYGGSAWRWSEKNTYTYREGTWFRTLSENTNGYGGYTTSYSKDDWESGVGIRKERSSDFDDMEEDWDSEEYDLEYEVSLDEPLTLEQAGKRWWLAPERVTDWEIEALTFAADVELSEDLVRSPDEGYLDYCDENCVLYSFYTGTDTDKGSYYLAMYRFKDKTLQLLAKEDAEVDYPEFYNGKIYYTVDIVENAPYKEVQDGITQVIEEEDTVGVRLNRMEPDGSGKETIFEYRYLKEGQEISEYRLPYLALLYEISGGDIFAEVYIGDEPHPIYRMKTDGSGVEKIGQVPKGD